MIFLKVILILLGLILLLALAILLTPLILYINTKAGSYYLKLSGIAKAQLIITENLFLIRLRVFFIPFSIDPFKPRKKKKKKPEKEKEKKPEKNGSEFSFAAGKKMIMEFFRSFKVKILKADVDTGDVISNAYLIPVFIYVNHDNIRLSVNNNGINRLQFKLQNRLINMLFIFLRYKIRSR